MAEAIELFRSMRSRRSSTTATLALTASLSAGNHLVADFPHSHGAVAAQFSDPTTVP